MKDDQAIEKLKPWLLNIQARAPGCPVLAVGTHLDLVEPAQSQKAMARLREKLDKMRGKPGMPKIVGHEFVRSLSLSVVVVLLAVREYSPGCEQAFYNSFTVVRIVLSFSFSKSFIFIFYSFIYFLVCMDIGYPNCTLK